MTDLLERTIPADETAERALLGALLIDPEAINAIAPWLEPGHFYRARNRVVYEACLGLYERREMADFVAISAEIARGGHLEQVGTGYLVELINAAPTSLHAEGYARTVERTAYLRRLIQAGTRVAEIGYGNPADLVAALDQAEQAVFEVSQRRTSREFTRLGDGINSYFFRLEEQTTHSADLTGVPSGFADLDAVTGGFQKADLIILAARPSTGKSALAVDMGRNAAKAGIPVAVFSLEMSVDQIVQRLLASEAGVDAQRMRRGYVDEHEWRQISTAYGVLADVPLWIDDTPAISVTELRAKARRLTSEHGAGLVIVDYIQLVRGTTQGRQRNRVEEVGEISRGLKALARELGVPVLALSQLSRAIEARQDHRPILSDLRESGSIEQDADLVMFVHREEMFNPNTDRRNVADLIVAKHRNGPTASIPLRFFPNQVTFKDLEVYRRGE